MLIPRLIYQTTGQDAAVIQERVDSFAQNDGKCILLNTAHVDQKNSFAQEIKKACLYHGIQLLVLDDLPIAAEINADGIVKNASRDYFRTRETLGPDKMMGIYATSIEEIADLNEEAVVDIIIIGDYLSDYTSDLLQLGKMQIQSILDDSRVLGYNIPILITGGIEQNNAESILKMGAYGLIFTKITEQKVMQELILKNPLKI